MGLWDDGGGDGQGCDDGKRVRGCVVEGVELAVDFLEERKASCYDEGRGGGEEVAGERSGEGKGWWGGQVVQRGGGLGGDGEGAAGAAGEIEEQEGDAPLGVGGGGGNAGMGGSGG
ncbi:MAG TPA: hypothetical protein VEI97_10825 [bacterium]|nr:hypothetical protein [bacterium]